MKPSESRQSQRKSGLNTSEILRLRVGTLELKST